MKVYCFIPARMGSSRFPGKPLHLINGKPLIEWVYESASKSQVDYLFITTPDEEIINFCTNKKYPFINGYCI